MRTKATKLWAKKLNNEQTDTQQLRKIAFLDYNSLLFHHYK